jgi:hypothetical protein
MVGVATVEFVAPGAFDAMAMAPARTKRATVRALNRALTAGKAQMATLVAKDMGLKSRDAKEAIRAQEATPDRLQVQLVASLRRLPLSRFDAKGPLPSFGRGRGVSYRIGSTGRGRVESAFLAQMSSGHLGVFRRTGKGRLPVIELFGPSIGRVFEKYRDPVVAVMRETFTARLAHELKFAAKADAPGA